MKKFKSGDEVTILPIVLDTVHEFEDGSIVHFDEHLNSYVGKRCIIRPDLLDDSYHIMEDPYGYHIPEAWLDFYKQKSTGTKKLRRPEYPCLKVDISGTFVVFFSNKNTGVVVKTQGTKNCPPLGYYSNNWNWGEFALYSSTVVLSNED